MNRSKLRKRTRQSLLELKPFLDQINNEVEQPDYIQKDPVQFMHAFSDKKDIEIAGFFAASMAWGRRDIVVAKVHDLLRRIGYSPYDFVMNYSQNSFDNFRNFKHRTFKPVDIHGMMLSMKTIYHEFGDFETFWEMCYQNGLHQNKPFLSVFREEFFKRSDDLAQRTRKHISDPENGSTCKRLYMFLRWCIRKNSPVDLGIWSFMDSSELLIPFDVHVARQARRYGLVTRRSNDWKTVQQLTETLKIMNPDDPARYDYALFGIGALGYQLPSRFLLNRI